MIQFLKKYFIPHEHNDHKPHLLRLESALIILGIALVVEIYFLAQVFWIMPSFNLLASVAPEAIINFTNQQRSELKLSSLKENPLLVKAAQLKAGDMAKNEYFDHISPAGITPWYWMELVGYRYNVIGENLAINFVDSQDAISAWMNSPKHRENILNNNFTEIGIGTANGLYQGKKTVFIVQFFGREIQPVAEAGATQQPKKADKTNQPITQPRKENKNSVEDVKPTPQIIESPLVEEKVDEDIKPIVSVTEKSIESFVAVKGITKQAIDPTIIIEQAEGEKSLWIKKLVATPRAISNYLYFVMLTIIALALVLKVFVKRKIQHTSLIVNGTGLLIVISLLIWVNQYISLIQTKII